MATDSDIIIVGGGPVGMMTAYMLAQRGQRSILIEQSATTTNYPKMEYTNFRTMEIYRRIGLLERVRAKAVPENFSLDETIVTGYGGNGTLIHTWTRESPRELRKKWAEINNGAFPLEPYMRQNQITFEALMKSVVQREPLIDSYWGFKFQSLIEDDDKVIANVIDPTGIELQFKSKYLIGCDGAGSTARKSAGLKSPRNTLPLSMLSVHFKSKEIDRLMPFGQFWHAMFLNGAVMVNQDESETWTVVQTLQADHDLNAALEALEPLSFIYQCLGGLGKPYEIKVDEVLVKYKWKADVAIAESFRSAKGRVFLVGDAAHQLSPVGGHGMNSGIQDAYDLSWKLDAVLRGYGSETLLDSYNFERRKIAQLNLQMVERATMEVVVPFFSIAPSVGAEKLTAQNEEGETIRKSLHPQMSKGHWLHGQDGVVLGYRYNGSPIVVPDVSTPEPLESVSLITEFVPTTWPGGRAPHVFLKDGKTSIFDLYGPDFTIVDFTPTGAISDMFVEAANGLGIPLVKLHLHNEKHCRDIWERDLVLVRPDGFVAWRIEANGDGKMNSGDVLNILRRVVGK